MTKRLVFLLMVLAGACSSGASTPTTLSRADSVRTVLQIGEGSAADIGAVVLLTLDDAKSYLRTYWYRADTSAIDTVDFDSDFAIAIAVPTCAGHPELAGPIGDVSRDGTTLTVDVTKHRSSDSSTFCNAVRTAAGYVITLPRAAGIPTEVKVTLNRDAVSSTLAVPTTVDTTPPPVDQCATAPHAPQVAPVLVIARDVKEGERGSDLVASGAFHCALITAEFKPTSAVVDPAQIADLYAIAPLSTGQVVVEGMFIASPP